MPPKSKKPFLSPERLSHVLAFLADFAKAYPELCDGDRAMYRDLLRAVLLTLDEEQKAEGMLVKRSVDDFLFRACREDVGAYLLRRLRQLGVNVKLVLEDGLRLRAEPAEKVTPAIQAKLRRWKQALRDALLAEELNEPEILNHTPRLGKRVSAEREAEAVGGAGSDRRRPK